MNRRLLENVGAFLVGGGVVAVLYELVRDPSARGAPDEAEAVAAGEVDAEAEPETSGGAADPGAGGDDGRAAWLRPDAEGHPSAFPPVWDPPVAMDAEAEAAFPKHGVVLSLAVVLRERVDLTSPMVGILRGGTRFRADPERSFGGGCRPGWRQIFPKGWLCLEGDVTIADEPPQDGILSLPEPQLEDPLPYEYLRVKDEMTPFFHRLPSFEEQNRADAAGAAWRAKHGREPMPTHPEQRPKEVPAVVKEYMNAGYWVTKGGEETKSQRRFLRTQRGTYARKYQLVERDPSGFRGLIVDAARPLPIHFVRREIPFQRRGGEGSDVLVATDRTLERLATHPFERLIQIGNHDYYEDAEGLLMRSYAIGRAARIKRPPGVSGEEHWIHIDLSEQVLVAYVGNEPVFATLVSTGKQPGMTPVGVHRVQSKHVATSMRDQPPEDEAYSIEDVPWTQYFSASVALHGAFWHGQFGIERSHGCVNLSPADARWLFGFTAPALPAGWHSAFAETGTPAKASPVVVTE